MKMFNGNDIDQNRLYVKNNCGKFIRALLERHGWSEPRDKEAKFIKTIHPDSVKELVITPGPYNEIEANDIQDKMGFN